MPSSRKVAARKRTQNAPQPRSEDEALEYLFSLPISDVPSIKSLVLYSCRLLPRSDFSEPWQISYETLMNVYLDDAFHFNHFIRALGGMVAIAPLNTATLKTGLPSYLSMTGKIVDVLSFFNVTHGGAAAALREYASYLRSVFSKEDIPGIMAQYAPRKSEISRLYIASVGQEISARDLKYVSRYKFGYDRLLEIYAQDTLQLTVELAQRGLRPVVASDILERDGGVVRGIFSLKIVDILEELSTSIDSSSARAAGRMAADAREIIRTSLSIPLAQRRTSPFRGQPTASSIDRSINGPSHDASESRVSEGSKAFFVTEASSPSLRVPAATPDNSARVLPEVRILQQLAVLAEERIPGNATDGKRAREQQAVEPAAPVFSPEPASSKSSARIGKGTGGPVSTKDAKMIPDQPPGLAPQSPVTRVKVTPVPKAPAEPVGMSPSLVMNSMSFRATTDTPSADCRSPGAGEHSTIHVSRSARSRSPDDAGDEVGLLLATNQRLAEDLSSSTTHVKMLLSRIAATELMSTAVEDAGDDTTAMLRSRLREQRGLVAGLQGRVAELTDALGREHEARRSVAADLELMNAAADKKNRLIESLVQENELLLADLQDARAKLVALQERNGVYQDKLTALLALVEAKAAEAAERLGEHDRVVSELRAAIRAKKGQCDELSEAAARLRAENGELAAALRSRGDELSALSGAASAPAAAVAEAVTEAVAEACTLQRKLSSATTQLAEERAQDAEHRAALEERLSELSRELDQAGAHISELEARCAEMAAAAEAGDARVREQAFLAEGLRQRDEDLARALAENARLGQSLQTLQALQAPSVEQPAPEQDGDASAQRQRAAANECELRALSEEMVRLRDRESSLGALLEAAQSQCAGLTETVGSLRRQHGREVAELQTQLADKRAAAPGTAPAEQERLQGRIRDLQCDVSAKTEQVSSLAAERDALQGQLTALREVLAENAAARNGSIQSVYTSIVDDSAARADMPGDADVHRQVAELVAVNAHLQQEVLTATKANETLSSLVSDLDCEVGEKIREESILQEALTLATTRLNRSQAAVAADSFLADAEE